MHGEDREVAQPADRVFDRAAKLVCANVLSLCLHCDGGWARPTLHGRRRGSTFYNSFLLRKKLAGYLRAASCEEEYQRCIGSAARKTQRSRAAPLPR